MNDAAAHLALRGRLRARVRSCTLCPLHARCASPVPWRGPIRGPETRPRLVVIGEAPGKQEDKAGKPFVGPAGKLMDEWVASLCDEFNGLRYDEVSFVNAVSCFPNRTPSEREVEACRQTLHAQLAVIDAEYALVVGGVAVSSFWKKMRIGDIRGRWWGLPIMQYPDSPESHGKPPLADRWIPAIATWHPAAVLRGNGADDIRNDLAQLRMALYPGARGPHETPTCVLCEKADMKGEVWRACDLGLGRNVTEEKGAPLSLNFCDKHDRHRTGRLDQTLRGKRVKAVETKVGLFDE